MIKPVSYADWLGTVEAQPLIDEYAVECSIPGIGPINPQPQMYAALENLGVLQSFIAYHGPGMAGFANVLTPILPHYGKRVATVETLFVGRDFRRYGIGRELMMAVEMHSAKNCAGILYSAPAGGQLERVLAAKRYQRTNAVFYRSFP